MLDQCRVAAEHHAALEALLPSAVADDVGGLLAPNLVAGFGAANPFGPLSLNSDIEALAFIVLLEARKSAQEDLRDILASGRHGDAYSRRWPP